MPNLSLFLRRAFVLVFTAFMLLTLSAHAGERLDFIVKQSQTQEIISVFLQGPHARMVSSANSQSVVIFDAKAKQLRIVDHHNKQVTRIDQASLDQLASLIEGVGKVAKSQGGVLGDLFKTFGLDNSLGEQKKISIKPLSEAANYVGIACQKTQVFEEEKLVTELCLASDFKMQKIEQETLTSLVRFTQILLQKGQSLLTQFGLPIPIMPTEQWAGLPIYVKNISDGTVATLGKHQHLSLNDKQFSIPSNYQESLFGL